MDRVVTTVRKVQELHPPAYGIREKLTEQTPRDRLLLGGWFDGENVQAPHLLVADWGAWTGGMGPAVLGGLTLVRLGTTAESPGGAPPGFPGFIAGAVQAAIERMKSTSFRGLFHFDVEEQPSTGELRLRGLAAGWPELHTFAFLAELENLASTLEGKVPKLRHKYVSVLPVSIPPWPNEHQGPKREPVQIQGLTSQQQGRCFWLDMQVSGRTLSSAGLDGLLAVATGASDSTPDLARARSLELAARLLVPEKQYRADAGAHTHSVLATLEDRYGFVVA